MEKRAPDLLSLSGLEAMQALIDGRHPPPSITQTLGFTLDSVAPGVAVFSGVATAEITNPLGGVHGGWALTLIDSCTGCAAHTTLPAGVGYTTVETKVNFVRPIKVDGRRVFAEGRVVAAGRTIITAEGKITDEAGKVLAHGTSTLMVLRPQAKE